MCSIFERIGWGREMWFTKGVFVMNAAPSLLLYLVFSDLLTGPGGKRPHQIPL